MIKIKEIYGYQLGYDESRRFFIIVDTDGTELAYGNTQDKTEEKAKALSKRDFVRIPIIRVNADGRVVKGEITSLDKLSREYWVSMEKEDNFYGSGRGKEMLGSNFMHYHEATERNLDLAKEIEAKAKDIADIKAEIEQLRTAMEKPINLEYFGMEA